MTNNREYLAHLEQDLIDFVDRIRSLNETQLRWFLANTINANLMSMHEQDVADIEEIRELAGSKVDRENLIVSAFQIAPKRWIVDLENGLIQHIRDGHDDFDADSVGGWSQSELILATAILRYAETLDAAD